MLAAILAAWVQFAADGNPHVRVATTDACPSVTIDGNAVPTKLRAAPAGAFAPSACDAVLPAGARSVRLGTRALPVPQAAPHHIVVFGDTGCRIAKGAAQACNDPQAWPFPAIAASIAAEKPDLIVHVGDFLYRERPCPAGNSGCANSPSGDTWPAWAADWFTPAAPLFGAAPLVLVRGNHESCARGGTGWFRYLEASLATACVETTAPYAIDAGGGLRLVLFDDSFADDATAPAALVPGYAAQLADARALANGESWFLTHRPPYLNATMIAAAKSGGYQPFRTLLAGHIHLFSAMNTAGQPPMIVNGEGGDNLSQKAELESSATSLGNTVHVVSDVPHFGYAVYDRARDGWAITLHDVGGGVLLHCTLSAAVRCG